MKKISFIAALALCALCANAAPRSASNAKAIAQQFVDANNHFRFMRNTTLSLACENAAQMAKPLTNKTNNPAYYIFNVSDGGFVVVSGDDRFKEILGYSTAGEFGQDELPDGLRYWLGFLSEEMTAAIEAGYEPEGIEERLSPRAATISVAPLIHTKWDQSRPYNNMLNGNMTGCVATGTAQVMNYWKYPEHGIGSHTGAYAPNYSADFGSTTYDWANMLDEYGTGWESKAEVDAVATLMLHVGVATDMRWSTDASATPNPYAAYALVNFFGYNPNLYIENRDHMSLGAWKSLIIDQLQTGHPLCYSGMEGNLGHFFVLDGYDAETGKFHFNWGWSGQFDGWYEMDALEPGTGGIGAGAGRYNSWQQTFINVQPTETGEYQVRFNATTVSMKNSNSKHNITIVTNQMSNDNTRMLKGNIGLAVYGSDGTYIKYLPSDTDLPIPNFNIGSSFSGEYPFYVDASSLNDGKYTVCAAACASDYGEKVFPIRARYGNPTYYTMTIAGDNVTFAPQTYTISLTADDITLTSDNESNVFQNVTASFLLSVTNTSAQEFYDEIGVQIKKGRGSGVTLSTPVRIAAGETKMVEVCGIIPASISIGDGYTATPVYGDNGTFSSFGTGIPVNIKSEIDGIDEIMQTTPTDNIAYNLAGLKVNNAFHGLIIKNGKKIVK